MVCLSGLVACSADTRTELAGLPPTRDDAAHADAGNATGGARAASETDAPDSSPMAPFRGEVPRNDESPSNEVGRTPLDSAAADVADAGPPAQEPESAPPEPEVAVSFAADIRPIFARRCGPCHTTEHTAGHNVGGALPGAYADAQRLGQLLLARIDGGSMPPSCDGAPGSEGCLSVADVELVRSWLEQGLPR